jgi:hypothetical protein
MNAICLENVNAACSLRKVAAPYKKQVISRVIGDQSKSADPSNYPPYFLWQIYP